MLEIITGLCHELKTDSLQTNAPDKDDRGVNCASLQRTNMRCPVHLSIGQEAAAVGVCHSLTNSDWVFSGHRNHAHYLALVDA